MSSVRTRNLALTAPAALFLAVFMIAPLFLMLYVSTLERAPFGGVIWGSHTLIAYEKLLFERDLAGALSFNGCLLYTSPSPRDRTRSRMPSSA